MLINEITGYINGLQEVLLPSLVKWFEPLFVVSKSDGMNDAVKLGILPGDVFGQFMISFSLSTSHIYISAPGKSLETLSFMCRGLNHIDDLCLCLGKNLADEVGDAFLVGYPEYDKRFLLQYLRSPYHFLYF